MTNINKRISDTLSSKHIHRISLSFHSSVKFKNVKFQCDYTMELDPAILSAT